MSSKALAKKEWELKITAPKKSVYAGGNFRCFINVEDYPVRTPTLKFRTKIYHPQVSNDGIGKFWIKSDSMRDSIKQILDSLKSISYDETMHINTEIGFEFMYDREYFFEIAKEQTEKYAVGELRKSGIYA